MIKKTKKISTGQNKLSSFNKILIILAIVAIIFLAFLVFKNSLLPQPYEIVEVPYDFKVKDGAGFNVDADIMHFGGSSVGARLKRSLNFSLSQDSLVKIAWEGPGVINVEDNNFIMKANEARSLNFTLIVPNLPLGDYNGSIYLKFYPVN